MSSHQALCIQGEFELASVCAAQVMLHFLQPIRLYAYRMDVVLASVCAACVYCSSCNWVDLLDSSATIDSAGLMGIGVVCSPVGVVSRLIAILAHLSSLQTTTTLLSAKLETPMSIGHERICKTTHSSAAYATQSCRECNFAVAVVAASVLLCSLSCSCAVK